VQTAVNDSAARVSTIWITFLIFSLYLLIATTTGYAASTFAGRACQIAGSEHRSAPVGLFLSCADLVFNLSPICIATGSSASQNDGGI
jgi:hypothetical protein